MAGLIHVGANDAAELAGEAGPLVLIEPQPDAFLRLCANFKDRDDVELVQMACAAAPGVADLNIATKDASSSLLRPKEHLRAFPHIRFRGRKIRVRCETLDWIMDTIGWERDATEFDRLLIDVQGYELEVLKGAERTLAKVAWLKCEVSTVEMYEGQPLMGDLDAHLATLGFERTEVNLLGRGHGDAIYTR